MLGSVRRLGFSETARSGPGHDKAGGGQNDLLASAVFGRRHLHDVAKRATEGTQAGEADLHADIGDASVGLSEHEHGPHDPPALKVAVGCLTERRLEGPDEMSLGHVRYLGEAGDIERISECAVDRVACAEHPAVQFLYGPAHCTILEGV